MTRGTVLPAVAALAAALAIGAILSPRAPAEVYLGRAGVAMLSIDADAAQALVEAQSGACLGSTAATTTRTHALPAAPSAGVVFRARANGTYGLRLDPGASDAIVLPADLGGATCPDGEYLELRPGASVLLVADAAGNWQAEALTPPFALQTATAATWPYRLPPMAHEGRGAGVLRGTWYPPVNGTAMLVLGDYAYSAGTAVGTAAVDYLSGGHLLQWTSSTSPAGNASWTAAGAAWDDWLDHVLPHVRFHLAAPTAATDGKRLFAGLAAAGAGTWLGGDLPAGVAGVGLWYSSSHSDNDLLWVVSNDGAAAEAVKSTHVTDHQAQYWVDLRYLTTTSVVCTLYSEAGEILSRETFTSGLPTGAGSLDILPCAGARNTGTTTPQVFRHYGAWLVTTADGS